MPSAEISISGHRAVESGKRLAWWASILRYGSQPEYAGKQWDHSEQRKDMDTGSGADPHGALSPGRVGKQGTRRPRQETY